MIDEKRFLNDVTKHKMCILRDDGVDRHIRFKRDNTNCYSFDLITVSGRLIITGDCGTYVFSRIEDMFEFFTIGQYDLNHKPEKQLNINPSYWGEKLDAICRQGGYKEFSSENFKESIQNEFDGWKQYSGLTEEVIKEIWEQIKDEILDAVSEEDAYRRMADFTHKDFEFDGCEYHMQDYTFSYTWCLYAIVWGIKQYRKQETELPKAVKVA